MLLWLLASCAIITKQADFDVDLPLFDEGDGAGVEPDALPMELKLYSERTDWKMPAFLDVEDWGAMLLADHALRVDGGDGFLAVDVSTVSLDSPGFVELTIRLESNDERRYLVDEPREIEAPAACTFDVTDTSTPDEVSDAFVGCFEAWTDTNGAPANPVIYVDATDTDLERFTLAIDFSLGTARPTELLCSGRLTVSEEMREEADNIDLNALELAGYVASVDGPMDLVAFQNTFPEEVGDPLVGGHTVVRLPGPSGTFVGQETPIVDELPASVVMGGVSPIDYFPDRDGWQQQSIDALETEEGYIEACWVAVHESEDAAAIVHFKLVGDGHYDGRE